MERHPWLQLILSLLSGFLFALGLIVSQMVNPAKVLNFLDIAGTWDPTLAVVMGGALLITIPGFRFILKRRQPLFAERFYLPTKQDIDFPLILGAAIFGVGWGLAGFCPGPALTALATGLLPVMGFVAAMITGALTHQWLFGQRRKPGGKVSQAPGRLPALGEAGADDSVPQR